MHLWLQQHKLSNAENADSYRSCRPRKLGLIAYCPAAAGYNTGIAWLDAWFGGSASDGGALAADIGGGDEGADGGAVGDCFLGIVCADASAGLNGLFAGATFDDDGVTTE